MIADWMTPDPHVASPDTRVSDALLTLGDARHLPVVGEGGLAGYLHRTDLERARQDERVGDLRLQDALTLSAEATLDDALRKLRASRHDALWLLRGDALAGVFTEHDAVRVAETRLSDDVVVEGVATAPVDVVDVSSTVGAARQTLARRWVRHLPVVDDDGRLYGLLSWRDLEGPADDVQVREIASRPAWTADWDTSLREVARMMVARHIGAVTVLDGDGALTGIVTRVDLIHAVLDSPEVS